MPFHPVPLKHGLCQFTHTDCRRNCPAAVADSEDQENWLCQWVESLKEMRQTMQAVTQAMQGITRQGRDATLAIDAIKAHNLQETATRKR